MFSYDEFIWKYFSFTCFTSMNELYITFSFSLSILKIIDSLEIVDRQGDKEESLFSSIFRFASVFKNFSLYISKLFLKYDFIFDKFIL